MLEQRLCSCRKFIMKHYQFKDINGRKGHIILVMPNTLPALLSPLPGREKELATIHELLNRADLRLVTITGPGGIGKTSTALQLGHNSSNTFKDGVFLFHWPPSATRIPSFQPLHRNLVSPSPPNRLLLDSLKAFLLNKNTFISNNIMRGYDAIAFTPIDLIM